MTHIHDRREFLKTVGAIGAATLVTGGCEQLLTTIANRPIRRNLAGLASNDPIIETYREAVAAMKALPAADPRNWANQAQIHFDHCPHGNWFFLPWHRAYLFYLEEICRELTGNDEFALPYWNWTESPSIPAAFWGTAANPLFDSTRSATPASTASAAIVGAANIQSILNASDFFTFASAAATAQREFAGYGVLEGQPHNYIHGFVGGNMGGYHSPLDPIFWMHHNMVECCWVEWNLVLQNPNSNDSQWTQFTFTDNFVDRDGNPVTLSVAATFLYPLLAYRFEPSQKGQDPSLITSIATDSAARAMRSFLTEGAAVTPIIAQRFAAQGAVEARVGQTARQRIALDSASFEAVLDADRGRFLLTLGEVEIPGRGDFFVRVFVNKPDAGAETSTDDPHYAGSFAFFGDQDSEHWAQGNPQASYIVDITEAVRRLRGTEGMTATDRLDIHLVPVPFPNRPTVDAVLRLNNVELGIGTVREN